MNRGNKNPGFFSEIAVIQLKKVSTTRAGESIKLNLTDEKL